MVNKYSNYTAGGGLITASDLDETQFKALGWIPANEYYKNFSYRLYQINRDSLAHFSKDSGGNWQADMAAGYANSKDGYSNLRWGIGWCESSTLATMPYRVGHAVIRDNDRPNAFLKMAEQKHPNWEYFCPSNVRRNCFTNASASQGVWSLLSIGGNTEANHNGVEDWDTGNIAGFDGGTQYTVGAVNNTFASPSSTLEIADLEMDIPALFTPLVSENIASTTILSFGLRDSGGAALPDADDITNQETQGAATPIRTLFRKAGTYRVFLNIKDSAKDWPSSANEKDNPTVATARENHRNLVCDFTISSSRLDVRVIDRSQGR